MNVEEIFARPTLSMEQRFHTLNATMTSLFYPNHILSFKSTTNTLREVQIFARPTLSMDQRFQWDNGFTTSSALCGVSSKTRALNFYSGWALVAECFDLERPLLACVGAISGFSGAILTKIMCDAMNQDIMNVLFGGLNTIAPVKKDGEKSSRGNHEGTGR